MKTNQSGAMLQFNSQDDNRAIIYNHYGFTSSHPSHPKKPVSRERIVRDFH